MILSKLSNGLRRLMKATSQHFYFLASSKEAEGKKLRLQQRAYYVHYRGALLSLKPYYGWRNAYKAAKRMHSKAFIICGSTINGALERGEREAGV